MPQRQHGDVIAADRAIEGIEVVFGEKLPIFGGTSSDNMRAVCTYQFIDEAVLERGAVMVAFADPSMEVVMGVHHGSVPVGLPMKVTRAEGNRVYETETDGSFYMPVDVALETEFWLSERNEELIFTGLE